MQDLLLAGRSVLEDVTLDVQILPTDEDLDGAHLQRLQGVVDAEAVLARVLRDLIEVASYQLLFLDKFHVGQALGGQLDGLKRRISDN